MIARVKISEAIKIAQYRERNFTLPGEEKKPAHRIEPDDLLVIKKLYFGPRVIRAPEIRKILKEQYGRDFSVVTIYRAIRKLETEAILEKRG